MTWARSEVIIPYCWRYVCPANVHTFSSKKRRAARHSVLILFIGRVSKTPSKERRCSLISNCIFNKHPRNHEPVKENFLYTLTGEHLSPLRNKRQRTTATGAASKPRSLVLCRFISHLAGTRKTHRGPSMEKECSTGQQDLILLCLRAPSCTTGGITLLSAHLLPPSFSEVPQGPSGWLYSTPHYESPSLFRQTPSTLYWAAILQVRATTLAEPSKYQYSAHNAHHGPAQEYGLKGSSPKRTDCLAG